MQTYMAVPVTFICHRGGSFAANAADLSEVQRIKFDKDISFRNMGDCTVPAYIKKPIMVNGQASV